VRLGAREIVDVLVSPSALSGSDTSPTPGEILLQEHPKETRVFVDGYDVGIAGDFT
jgi:hypothetical protein